MSSVQLATLDYPTLEAILELNTLRLRALHLRIYVENPPNSGTFCKIRHWKNDGTLQSVLIRDFFEGRLRDGLLTTLEIRDGQDRDDALSIKSGHTGTQIIQERLAKQTLAGKEWLRKKGLTRASSTSPTGQTSEEEFGYDGEASLPGFFISSFFSFFFFSRPPFESNAFLSSLPALQYERLRWHSF